MLKTYQRSRGFTRTDLVVVIIMTAIFFALFTPAVYYLRQKAVSSVQCSCHVAQISLAVHDYHSNFNRLPPMWCDDTNAKLYPGGVGGLGTLHFFLLPYLEKNTLYDQSADASAPPVYSGANIRNALVKVFICWSDPSNRDNLSSTETVSSASCNYAGNTLVFDPNGVSRTFADLPNGTSNTVMFAERYKTCGSASPAWAVSPAIATDVADVPKFGAANDGNWKRKFPLDSTPSVLNLPQVAPTTTACNPATVQGPHSAGIVVGIADGSTRLVSPKVGITTWRAVCNQVRGQGPGSDW